MFPVVFQVGSAGSAAFAVLPSHRPRFRHFSLAAVHDRDV